MKPTSLGGTRFKKYIIFKTKFFYRVGLTGVISST
ncbi:hypothetical protein THIOKS1470019 [Thiocapsa sp. KS1]|nr:hypothetical protein THIOKS1470019 [Thiocapsa sp. KS1]